MTAGKSDRRKPVRAREVRLAVAVSNAMTGDPGAITEPRRVLVGLLGHGIQLSRSPTMHEAEGRAQGLSYIYRLIDTDRMGSPAPPLADIVAFTEHLGFDGFNVTFPYKQEILPLLDELSESAAALGSVNTVVLRGGRRVGHNTDLWGFKESFRRGMPGAPRDSVLLLGAGGAGAAVADSLFECGVGKLILTDLDASKVSALAVRLTARFGVDRVNVAHDIAAAAAAANGIVNATPVGMAKLPGIPLDPSLLRRECWVADIVYFPLDTALLIEARKRGCRTLSGEGMAIFQAVRAFELFTGIQPNAERMKAAFAAFKEKPSTEKNFTETGRKT
jgi:shikimate dehydrogenase